MTTNGLTLTKLLAKLHGAGLNALNVSLDTLHQNKYENITRRDGRLLKRVIAGIDLALQLEFRPIKVGRNLEKIGKKQKRYNSNNSIHSYSYKSE